jgi:hypothetical protein
MCDFAPVGVFANRVGDSERNRRFAGVGVIINKGKLHSVS